MEEHGIKRKEDLPISSLDGKSQSYLHFNLLPLPIRDSPGPYLVCELYFVKGKDGEVRYQPSGSLMSPTVRDRLTGKERRVNGTRTMRRPGVTSHSRSPSFTR